MGNEMEIMDAEMVGIKKAVEQGVKECRRKGVRKLVIRIDSQEAMRRIGKRERGPGEMMAHKVRWEMDAARTNGITTTFEWVKAHVGINGNEKADALAKKGTKQPRDKDSFISLAYLEAKARSDSITQWTQFWKNHPSKGSRYELEPTRRKVVRFAAHEREGPVILSRLRTEHIWVHEYAKRIGKRDDDKCECGKGKQDVKHVLTECMFSLDAREEAIEVLGEELSIALLLYTSEGAKWGIEIWKEFKRGVREARGEVERENEELDWGFGELER